MIEPKQINVEVFSGGLTDNRTKFLEWSERVFDRIMLFDSELANKLSEVGAAKEPISPEKSIELGVSKGSNEQLQGFLKDKTDGIAGSLVRNNVSGTGLESWRLLCAQFNPQRLTGTLNAQHQETHPRGAKTMAELPGRLLEWERNLRRCLTERRQPPSEEAKRWPSPACCN